jgi:hypothetical protein
MSIILYQLIFRQCDYSHEKHETHESLVDRALDFIASLSRSEYKLYVSEMKREKLIPFKFKDWLFLELRSKS